MKTIATYRRHCSLAGLINDKINKKITKRIERLSAAHNQKRNRSIAVFANEHIGIQINQHGIYDRLGLEILFSFLSPISKHLNSGLALDIGANIGNHSLYFFDRFDRVFCFEPNPTTYLLLSFNLRGLNNVVPFNCGLGHESGMLALNENMQNMGESSIKYSFEGEQRSVQVEIKTLDEFSEDISKLVFMKIDVEGFEHSVLSGGVATIRAHQPVIVMEQHAAEFHDGSTDAIRLLNSFGYKFCWHQPVTKGKGWLGRQSRLLLDAVFKRTQEYKIVTSDTVPRGKYGMLMAIPPRFQEALGFEQKRSDPAHA